MTIKRFVQMNFQAFKLYFCTTDECLFVPGMNNNMSSSDFSEPTTYQRNEFSSISVACYGLSKSI